MNPFCTSFDIDGQAAQRHNYAINRREISFDNQNSYDIDALNDSVVIDSIKFLYSSEPDQNIEAFRILKSCLKLPIDQLKDIFIKTMDYFQSPFQALQETSQEYAYLLLQSYPDFAQAILDPNISGSIINSISNIISSNFTQYAASIIIMFYSYSKETKRIFIKHELINIICESLLNMDCNDQQYFYRVCLLFDILNVSAITTKRYSVIPKECFINLNSHFIKQLAMIKEKETLQMVLKIIQYSTIHCDQEVFSKLIYDFDLTNCVVSLNTNDEEIMDLIFNIIINLSASLVSDEGHMEKMFEIISVLFNQFHTHSISIQCKILIIIRNIILSQVSYQAMFLKSNEILELIKIYEVSPFDLKKQIIKLFLAFYQTSITSQHVSYFIENDIYILIIEGIEKSSQSLNRYFVQGITILINYIQKFQTSDLSSRLYEILSQNEMIEALDNIIYDDEADERVVEKADDAIKFLEQSY